MAGLVLPNIGVFGSSGSGKTSFVKTLIEQIKPRVDYVVIVNASEELKEFANHAEEINIERAEQDWNPEKLAKFIAFHKSVHFEVLAARPVKFLDALAKALKLLGKYDATRAHVLLVVDECHKYLSKHVYQRSQAVQAIDLELRKYGIIPLKITPRIQSTSQDAIAYEAITQCRQIFIFPFNADVDIRAAEALGFPDPSQLLYPDPDKKFPPEYFAKDTVRGTMFAIRRKPDGSRKAVQLRGLAMNLKPFQAAQRSTTA